MAENPPIDETPDEPEITTETEVATETIPFETKRVENSDMLEGEEEVVQEGVNGEREITTEHTFTDGELTDSEVVNNVVTLDPIDEIVEYGTKVVTTETNTETEDIPFEIERVENSTLFEGEENVLVEGQLGILEKEFRLTYENGELVSSELINENVIKEPINMIVEYGTRINPADNNLNNRRKRKMSIVWRDKVLSSHNGNIESVMIYDADDNQVEVPNGVFVKLGELEGREVRKATLATANDVDEEILLVSTPEVTYESGKNLDDFVNEAGVVARAFRLADGDIISMTVDLFNGTPAVGDTLHIGNEGKLTVAGDDAEAKIAFIVDEDAGHELTREQEALRLRVIR